jgi:hypothetical protein
MSDRSAFLVSERILNKFGTGVLFSSSGSELGFDIFCAGNIDKHLIKVEINEQIVVVCIWRPSGGSTSY